jgi:penicillin amidase
MILALATNCQPERQSRVGNLIGVPRRQTLKSKSSMTTSILVPSSPRTSGLRRLLTASVSFIVLAVLCAGAYLYSVARRALPQLDGELTVAGLSAPVTVTRDQHGMPMIEAANLQDLFFAQGYVTAQDRLWQMEGMRRFAAGELAEILGESQLPHDRQQRILGLRAVAHHSLELATPQDRILFEAYARGVNAYLQSHTDRLPFEFRILRYMPKPWTAEDSLLMGAYMVQSLNHGGYRTALQREKILAKLGPELTADLYVNSSWHDRPPTKGPVRLDEPEEEDRGEDSSVSSLLQELRETGAMPSEDLFSKLRPGSNNWVVSGAHTVSGKPLLANDMHLDHQMPNLWYEVHLHSGNLDVVGVSLPGTPFVIVGHNQHIAWGFTNVSPTVEDLYIETFNDKGQYLTPQGWRDIERRREDIHVKGKSDEVVDVPITRHGPIITELIPGEKRPLALRWTAYDGLNEPFFEMDSAQNWNEFRRALSTWDAPSQNAVYADVDGHIGYQATGKIPIRAAGDGSLPENGSDDAHEWKGYVPFDKLPSIFDPPWGILATANGRIVPDGYPYSLSTEWEEPWRTERIYRVLESGKKFAPADMLALQTDIYSAFDRFCAERFVYVLDHAKNLTPRAAQARDLLRDWDGRMSADSPAPAIEVRATRELARLLLEPKLGSTTKDGKSETTNLSWRDYRWAMASVWLENILEKQPKRWLPDAYADYDALLTAAVETAVNDPAAPKKLSLWRWGKASPLYIQHPVLGNFPVIRRWTGPGLVPQSGGGLTVKQVGREFGPSERLTVDFSDFDQSTLNLVTGESGNFLSPYYMDQWKAWYEGFTFALPFSPQAVEKSKAHKLVLQPGK